MSLPNREEIRAKAVELFHADQQRKGLPLITPEDSELREGNYWLSARNELMRGLEGELEQALALYEEEAKNLRELLGVPVTDEAKMTELEGKVIDLESRLGRTRDQLKKTKEEVSRLEAELRQAKAKPTIAPLREEEEVLPKEDINLLYLDLDTLLIRAKVSDPSLYHAEFSNKIDYKKNYTENVKIVERFANDIIKRVGKEWEEERPKPTITPEIESRLKTLEEKVEHIFEVQPTERELPPRTPIIRTVVDWYDNETLVTVDQDEIWRLRQILPYKESFYYLSEEHQRKLYGVTTKSAVKWAIANERITRNHVVDMGLNPQDYYV